MEKKEFIAQEFKNGKSPLLKIGNAIFRLPSIDYVSVAEDGSCTAIIAGQVVRLSGNAATVLFQALERFAPEPEYSVPPAEGAIDEPV